MFKLLDKVKDRVHYLMKCDKCGREEVFIVKLENATDDEPRAMGNGVVKRRCGGKYKFVREVPRDYKKDSEV